MRKLSDDDMRRFNQHALRKFFDIIAGVKLHLSSFRKPPGKLCKWDLIFNMNGRTDDLFFGDDDYIRSEVGIRHGGSDLTVWPTKYVFGDN